MNESKNTPKVSVVIPTYNRGDLIGETIRSLQDQDFEDFEVIIVDDGSTDHTATVCEAYSTIAVDGCTSVYFWRFFRSELPLRFCDHYSVIATHD